MNKNRPVNQLRGRRAALGLSQADVAAHLECSASRVSLIENGHYDATPKEQALWAALLKCLVSDIFPKQAA